MKYIVKKIINCILDSMLYFSIFYILCSIIKFIYMCLVDIMNISRVTIGYFYVDELIIAFFVLIFMFRYIRVENGISNHLK